MSDHTAPTRFCLIRHATVSPESLAVLYGQMDVAICPLRRTQDQRRYSALGAMLPKPAKWLVTPLSRTRATAEAIMSAGYGTVPLDIEPALIEQNFGLWQGSPMSDFANRPAQHPFWPVGGDEVPPSGESFNHMRHRVGAALARLATEHAGEAIVVVSHGGTIRAAVAEALALSSHQALSLAVDNLSITRIERYTHAWRIVSLNEQISI
ncbi:MAG: histidine phosphatase family protein [Acidiphilium sp.]|nr:histidine phosphatase family protein [Acidiphilium sp.]MDD4934952.1 histidine phosphatase family protein [Acidiphilium sp.]